MEDDETGGRERARGAGSGERALAWARLKTLEEVLHSCLELVDVIVQDEYTHDIVTQRGEEYIVFDATWLGAITAVSVWDHRPTADELLEDRIAHGWRPTPTGTVDGPRVLGHAACRFSG